MSAARLLLPAAAAPISADPRHPMPATSPTCFRGRLAALALAGSGLLAPAAAQELSWSGFGTVGLAASNRDFTYQRFITRDASLARDSVFGLQADVRLGPQWSATLQLKLAPSLKSDARWDLVPAWGFLAWRPNDAWLLRAGRLRLPLYLHSEALDVGQAHDMARLPIEVYSVAPSYDINGLFVTRSFTLGERGDKDLSIDAYHGAIDTTARFWTRDGAPPQVPAGPQFRGVVVTTTGLAGTWRGNDLLLRASVHRIETRQRSGDALPVRFPFVPVAPGLGYYQVNNQIPGPGVPEVAAIRNTLMSLGGEYSFAGGWRVAGEYVRNRQQDTELASDTRAAYVAVFKRLGKFTPYVSLSQLNSSAGSLDWYQRLTANPLPAFIPGASQLNAAQRLSAESLWVADQQSLALGSAYALSPQLKLKGEWQRSRIGQVSRLIDTLAGSPTPHDTTVDVWSLNLNFAF